MLKQERPVANESSWTTLFCQRAESVGADVRMVSTADEAVELVVQTCLTKPPCELLTAPPEGTPLGPLSQNGVPTRMDRVLAMPRLPEPFSNALHAACVARGIRPVQDAMRAWVAGVDVGVSVALLGIAESGTCLLNTTDEDARLAGMLCETHVILLPESALVPRMADSAPVLRALQAACGMSTYITGPSRTADIERVPAVGVHGPLALTILLVQGSWLPGVSYGQ